MSGDDVYPDEMNEPHDFDDGTADAFLSGGGRDIDPRLADRLGDMRIAYTSIPPAIGANLSALMRPSQPVPPRPSVSRRFVQMRSSIIAKIGVAGAAVVAATGGLAAANALPAPVQDAVSHIGVPGGSHQHPHVFVADVTTTTVDSTSTTTEPARHHGDDGSEQGTDDSGCGDVTTTTAAASGGVSNGDGHDASNDDDDPSCVTTTTVAETTTTVVAGTTTTTTADTGDDHDGDHQNGNSQGDDGSHDSGNQDGNANRDEGGGDHHGSTDNNSNGGDSGASHGDHSSSGAGQGDSGSGGGD